MMVQQFENKKYKTNIKFGLFENKPDVIDKFIISHKYQINFSKEQLDLFDEINTFNIKGRYDDYRFKFYEKATREYTNEYFKKVNILYLWLQKQI